MIFQSEREADKVKQQHPGTNPCHVRRHGPDCRKAYRKGSGDTSGMVKVVNNNG